MRTLGVSVEKLRNINHLSKLTLVLFCIIVGFIILYIYNASTQKNDLLSKNLKVNLILSLIVIK